MHNEIQSRAFELGFDLAGITSAAPPPHATQFHQWVAAGFHGEMSYMARRAGERANPDLLLQGAKSIVVVGLNYFPGDSPHIARYAAGERDYHEVMGEKLRLLAEFIESRGGKAKWYVDTGPVLERDLAQRAGLGWAGKHTNLINRSLGNWFFLGAVLTTLELPVGEAARDHCGKCTRCITACPTGAIVAPYRLDARRCISYLTIELKGSIPVEMRELIGGRVFGCDDCLEVCPWNRFARVAVRRRELPALVEFLAWDESQFRRFFSGTSMERLKRRGFIRNVCVALGNTGDESVVPALERATLDLEPLIREHAAWAVDRISARGS